MSEKRRDRGRVNAWVHMGGENGMVMSGLGYEMPSLRARRTIQVLI